MIEIIIFLVIFGLILIMNNFTREVLNGKSVKVLSIRKNLNLEWFRINLIWYCLQIINFFSFLNDY